MSIKIVSRGKGKSAVAAAAYRAGEKILNEYDGITHDYTRKGGVAHTEILLPSHAPSEYTNRSVLWNAVEQAERNKNAQLAREIELALPVELSQDEKIALAREYCQRQFVSAGMCADICIHDKNDGNPHAHILLTMRPIAPDGSWAAKSRKEYILDENGQRIRLKSGTFKTRKVDAVDWNDQSKAEVWRQNWAEAVNAALEHNNMAERIDHRCYARQGIEHIPTVHLGVAATQMERRGIATARGDLNRQIRLGNSMLRQLKARIRKLQNWLKEAMNIEPTTLADVVQAILSRREQQGRRQHIDNSENAAKLLGFLAANNITDMAGLKQKVESMYAQQLDIRDRLKPIERRLNSLDEHIRQAGRYQEHQDIYAQYQQIRKPKKQAAFYEQNRAALMLFEAAGRYLRPVMNGHTALPLTAWQKERDKLFDDRGKLYREYAVLKEGVGDAERVKWAISNLLREETQKINAAPERKQKGYER